MVTRAEDLEPRCVIDFDHNAESFQKDELAQTAELRQKCPVAFSTEHGGFWVVTGYEEVARISRDDAFFAHKFDPEAADGASYIGTMGIPRPAGHVGVAINEAEGPIHSAMRKVMIPQLSPGAVRALEPFMQQVTAWFMDQIIEEGQADLMPQFLTSVTTVITLEMLGLPLGKWPEYAHLVHNTSAFPPGSKDYEEGVALFPGLIAELEQVARDRKADPKDDLATLIINIEVDGEPMTGEHFARIMFNLLAGGIDTTASLTGLALLHMGRDHALRQRLISDPELYAAACEEFLRYFSPAQTISRTARADTVVGEQEMRHGDPILISYLGANHDPRAFPRPDEIVLEREANRHVAFGLGAHRCVGSNLARVEFRILLGEVLRRIPDYVVDFPNVKEYLGFASITGLMSLPVTFPPGEKVGAEPLFEVSAAEGEPGVAS